MAAKSSCGKIFSSIICWIIQFAYWAAWVFIAYCYRNSVYLIYPIITLLIVGLIYFLTSFDSKVFRYTKNTMGFQSVSMYMLGLFNESPKVGFEVRYYGKDTIGNKIFLSNRVDYFKYIRSTDQSQQFKLDTDQMVNSRKHFIKLKLSLVVQFSEDGTQQIYMSKKKAFFSKNLGGEISDIASLNGLNEYNLVTAGKNASSFVYLCLFTLIFLIGMTEFYKLYINYFSIKQKFTIVKIISATRDLNNLVNHNDFQNSIHSLEIKEDDNKSKSINLKDKQTDIFRKFIELDFIGNREDNQNISANKDKLYKFDRDTPLNQKLIP